MMHVVAVDGYLLNVVGFIMLPVKKKNAIARYDCLFRPLLLNEGLWLQARVDHGRESSLYSVQQGLGSFPVRQDRVPYLQTVS